MYWKATFSPMKNILQRLSLGLFVVTLSSCVDAGGYVSTRPGYSPLRSYHNNGDYSNGYYGHYHQGYYQSRPAPQPAGVNARVNARVLPLNVSSSTSLGLF